MKLRTDLLEYVTAEDISEMAELSVGRYSAEPVFAKTGVGYLRSATEEEKIAEMAAGERFIERVKARQASDLAWRAAASLDSSQL